MLIRKEWCYPWQDDGFGNLKKVKCQTLEKTVRQWFDEHYQYHDF